MSVRIEPTKKITHIHAPDDLIITIAIAGNPNAGKTSIFNAITGSNQHVGNYAGVTVEKKEGSAVHKGYTLRILDLPGTYSLTAYSLDEIVARDFIMDEKPDIVINVIDANNLERNLNLSMQLQELNIPMVAALNMSDEAEARGTIINEKKLSAVLGIPMVKTVGNKGSNLDALLDAAVELALNPVSHQRQVEYGREVEGELKKLTDLLKRDDEFVRRYDARWIAVKLLERDAEVNEKIVSHTAVDAIKQQTEKSVRWIERHFGQAADTVVAEQRYAYIHGAVRESVIAGDSKSIPSTDVIDAVLLHRVLGLPIFFLIIWGIFQLTFILGEWPMKFIEWLFSQLGHAVTASVPPSILRDLIVEGVIGGVGGMLTFVPNILILFFCISFLEDTGYMARAAFLMDNVMHRIGLHGQSFIPLITGFGCSVPAIMSARTLRNDKDRITTVLIIPLMSCGARLPVYALLIGAFFPASLGGNILFLIYLIGILLAILMALFFRKVLFRGASSPFVMELPPYRMPTANAMARHMGEKAWMYLKKAGTIILASSIVIWFLTTFPREHHAPIGGVHETRALEMSYAGQIGKLISPVLTPLGFDWKAGIALITGFAAKEMLVSSMGTIYKVKGNPDESLREALRADPSFTPLKAFTLMLFVLIYIPCLATLAVVKQELGSFKWVLLLVGYTSALAWIVSFVVFQVGRFFGAG
ncbi:MAG: ferrous iron transport protein B [Spirochaetes bacterium]|nr:ferrous iron transport protein B [Spirochaetota bacterium]